LKIFGPKFLSNRLKNIQFYVIGQALVKEIKTISEKIKLVATSDVYNCGLCGVASSNAGISGNSAQII